MSHVLNYYIIKYEEMLDSLRKQSEEILVKPEEKSCPQCGAKLILRATKEINIIILRFIGLLDSVMVLGSGRDRI